MALGEEQSFNPFPLWPVVLRANVPMLYVCVATHSVDTSIGYIPSVPMDAKQSQAVFVHLFSAQTPTVLL